MTTYELNQSSSVFTNAGSRAFNMGLTVGSNPYTDKYAKFWRNGFKTAEFKAGGKYSKSLKKNYFIPELELVNCENCGDEYLEGKVCFKCNKKLPFLEVE